MLEIKNLNKTYYPKAGSKVNALNNINLKIQEKGLIFILGKSGSGKSTLLNLLGGLDQYDSGNIIIKGRSTKDFKQKDFDAYRNTSVGFVFQEYNLLDDFTVGANIALAIELQGRKSTNEEINAILKEVDLEGYGKRKTNELSGGQKQRVAIARALVKHPEIILADEPTGALDSKTGLQIFDILKRLAKDKLVLVVSHDREFAESYGDRVIELSDGKIIGDITKVKNQSDKFIEQLNYSENEGFVVSEEYVLTQADLKQINDYLDKNKKLQITKKAIDEINVLEEFVETNEDLELKKYDGFNMLKSKIPFQVAFKMGASALNHKKIRLVFTILLSMVAFVLFGVSDTLGSYNKVTAFTNSIMENNIETVVFSKEKEFERTSNNSSWFDYNTVQMNDNDLEKLEYLTGLKLKPVYSEGGNVAVNSYPYDYALSTNRDSNYSNFQRFYSFAVKGFTEINMDEIKKLGFTLHGKLPENDNEIVITNYTYEHFKNFKHKDKMEILVLLITIVN